MTAGGDWGEIIDKEEAERFVGREQELETFRQQIGLAKPRYLIFYITGQGGAGKTTLLNRYQQIAGEHDFLLAECDEQQRDVPAVLGRFAHQLAGQGSPLESFEKRYKIYRQKMHEIENDPEAPQGLAAILGRTVVRTAFIAGDAVPVLRKGLEILPQDSLETQASEWAAYLAKKLTNKDEVALVREPVPILTPLFFEDLNKTAQKWKVLLCFDNFEATRPELREWLLRLREYKPSQNIRIAIAGRDQPGAKWDPLRSVTQTIHIDVFTEQEAEAFLDVYGVTGIKRRKEILELSGRLPVLMSWLAAAEGSEAETSIPTHDIVERFLRWVAEPALRQVALLAAIPRSFNVDILKLLLEKESQTVDELSAFDWLQTMPFVKQGSEGWYYHDVVRRMMLHYQHQKSPQTYRQAHDILANFYNTHCDELSSSGEQWINEEWHKYTLAYAYHFLITNPNKHWGEVMSLFAVAIHKHQAFAIEMIEMLNLDDVDDELSAEQNDTLRLFHQQLEAIKDGTFKNGVEMFDRLCSTEGLSSQAKGYALAYCGECHQEEGKWEKALIDFGEALHYIPKEAWIFARRANTYRQLKHYQEALADYDQVIALDEKNASPIARRAGIYRDMGRFQEALGEYNKAIALDEENASIIARRGLIYNRLGRYQEALADLNRAIALDEKELWAIAERGYTYCLLGRYQEALIDLDSAITLDETNVWFFALRGEIYCLMERYQEALADFDRAIALDEKDAWAIVSRGQMYRLMERYQEALADFDRAIALDEKLDWAIANRGQTYRQVERYQEALADFDRAIALKEKEDWYRYRRAQVYMLIGQIKAFESDIQAAIKLGQAILHSTPDDCRSGFNLALYYLAAGNVTETESQYTHFALACSSLARLQDAVDDLTDFLTIQPSNELAQRTRIQLQTRIAELQQSPTE